MRPISAAAGLAGPNSNDGVLGIRDRIPGARHFITLAGGTSVLLDYEALLAAEPSGWPDVAVHHDAAPTGGPERRPGA